MSSRSAGKSLVVAACLIASAAGCGMTQIPAQENSPAADNAAQPPAMETPENKEPAAEETGAKAAPEGNLWTRQEGSDWGPFLGPTGDGKSPEKGILTQWPKEGLKTVWEKALGTSYGAPAISQGRLFQFDRFGRMARVYCLQAETGDELWRYEYPTAYEDYYGYNNGPRCSPVVDGDRVYAYGAEGVLVCLNAITGKLLWKVETAKDFGVVQNFFGNGSNVVVEGKLLLAMVGGSPPRHNRHHPGRGQRQRDRRLRQVDRRGQIQNHGRIGELCFPEDGHTRWPPLWTCLLSGRTGRFRTGYRQGRFPLSLAGANPRKRQRQHAGGRRQ
jgi:hypothetical protein